MKLSLLAFRLYFIEARSRIADLLMTYCNEDLADLTYEEFIDWIIDEEEEINFGADKHGSLWNLFKEQLKIVDSYEVSFAFIQK